MKRYFVYYVAFNGNVQIGEGNSDFECVRFNLAELIKTLVVKVSGATNVVIRYLVEL